MALVTVRVMLMKEQMQEATSFTFGEPFPPSKLPTNLHRGTSCLQC
jgi:hypothetical protein